MPHRAFSEMRARYVALNGARPTPPGTLSKIEDELGVDMPEDFLRVCEFYDGTGVVSEDLAVISAARDGDSVAALTRQFRTDLALPTNYLVLGASDTSVLLLDCSPKRANAAAVHRVLRTDIPLLVVGKGFNGAKAWPSFAEYFRDLLGQEESS